MRNISSAFSCLFVFSAVFLSQPGRAANLTTTNVQGSGANWTAAIWKTNGTGTAVAPVAANTYEMIFNGISIANGANSTRVRNPAAAGLQTFPGVSLTMNTNSELRAKTAGAILNFPGTGGNPGLFLNGGLLNGGDDTTFAITGRVHVVSQSYISHGANGGGGGISANRAFNFTGILSGSGNMVILNSGTTVAQRVSNFSNTFSGEWILQCGWLLGATNNSLGTNNITVDPNYAGQLAAMPNFQAASGTTRFEVNYDINSAGILTLTNAGKMRLHQNCFFASAIIEGTPLSAGTHSYAELLASFPNNFETGGSGSITIQPFTNILPPVIGTQPLSQKVYAGRTAQFSVAASTTPVGGPISYQWRKNSSPLSDGGNISGATNATLVISNVSASDVTTYDVVLTNLGGETPSSSASLSLATMSGEAYEAAVVAANPVAFYQLNETGDPATNNSPVFDYVGGYAGIYGTAAQNGNPNYNIAGPRSVDGFPGFDAANTAIALANLSSAARTTVTPWNLNTNIVTMIAWINPSAFHNTTEGIVFSRGNGTVVGLHYNTDAITGGQSLGYHWNNEAGTYNWGSGLTNVTPAGQWSMVSLVVTPTNAIIYVMNTNGITTSQSHEYSHVVQTFSGTTLIGDDAFGAAGARVFNGTIDDVAVFNSALSQNQLLQLYSAASGSTNLAPVIGAQPASQTLYEQQNAQFSVVAVGSEPLTYLWRAGVIGSGTYSDLSDGGQISGATTSTLTISNITGANALDYIVVVSNSNGSTNSNPATLTVLPTGPSLNITLGIQQPAGSNWDTITNWSDGTGDNTFGVGASTSTASNPGSTYTLLPGSRLRTPEGPGMATFPGEILTLNGDGVWNLNPPVGSSISEIRFKQVTYGTVNGRVNFKRLVMNGGQLDAGNDGTLLLGGQIDILTNAPFNNDGGNDRGYYVDALLTGTGTIEYHGYNQTSFRTAYTNNLNIAGTGNTFSGTWNVVIGTLLATGLNALGTNDIIVGTNGAVEATYDINNPNGDLLLNGKMYLHQNHTFRTVSIGNSALNQGTFTFAQLAALYPSNFPATWTQQNGSSFSSASGSITVVAAAAPTIVTPPVSQSIYPTQTAQFSVMAAGFQPLSYQWSQNGTPLIDGTTAWGSVISGATTANLSISNVTNNDGGTYMVVITNTVGSANASAVLTIRPTGPAENITLNYGGVPIQQAGTLNWNTITNWSDGLAASESSLAKPGSTYEVVAGSRLRSPENITNSVFSGSVLTVSGDGVWINNPPANNTTIGEIRFKQFTPFGTVDIKKLVLNGGQLDLGNDGVLQLTGELNVLTNSTLNNNSANDRGYQIDSWLTGTGNIEYHGYIRTNFSATFVNSLNLTGTSNTFSGKWNIVIGTLLGSGTNSLGTNDITIGTNAALETLYDISNPNGKLTLDGQMFLHQNDTFHSMSVGGVGIAAGTYTFAQLNTAYPTNFPAVWTQQTGSTVAAGSGSITLLASSVPPPVTLTIQRSGQNLELIWSQGVLLEADTVDGTWTPNATATSPYPFSPGGPQKFYKIQVQ